MRHLDAVASSRLTIRAGSRWWRMYRQPLRTTLLEPSAGMVDPGESPIDAAQRGWPKRPTWRRRAGTICSRAHQPGLLGRALWVYLARDLALVPRSRRHAREDEAAEMTCAAPIWIGRWRWC